MDIPELGDKQKEELRQLLKGDVYFDQTMLLLYSTDASAYREVPLAVTRPRDPKDIELIIGYAQKYQVPVIPRGAGTSLAGQVVGRAIIVDVSKYLNHIIEINKEEKWVIVEPGVVLDELNKCLSAEGLFFGPETSTSNRCNIGGMVGNNSCGSHSLVYGSTRDHLLEVTGYLSNGEKVTFKSVTPAEFEKKCTGDSLEGSIYSGLNDILNDPVNSKSIIKEYPHPEIKRRNTGYALDLLLESFPLSNQKKQFNMCEIIAGSEGTLMFITQIKLNLVSLPPKHNALVCIHFLSLEESVSANIQALKHQPVAVELMDKLVLDLTKENTLQNKNRFFIEGDPKALLLIEFAEESETELEKKIKGVLKEFKSKNLGYTYPVLYGSDIGKVWSLRKAGLGVLSNIPGDQLPVPVVEDTAIRPDDMPDFVNNIQNLLTEFGKECVFYGHIGSGELHLRPVLNMKREDEVKLFRRIAEETAKTVKHYKGSLSGEHGDGRLRGEFIPLMIGEHNYNLLKKVKNLFDPSNILNPGKIVDTPSMDTFLRYKPDSPNAFKPIFRWDKTGGLVQGADKCTGSADCRKSSLVEGTMCPSYMATKNEIDSTRGRANILREFFTGGITIEENNLDEVLNVLDLCLSCKACKSECPSSIDMAKLKTEFLNYYHQKKGSKLRERIIANQPVFYRYGAKIPSVFNALLKTKWITSVFSGFIGMNKDLILPEVAKESLTDWYKKRYHPSESDQEKTVVLIADEFTDLIDENIGKIAVELLSELGYHVLVVNNIISGRTYLSKGFLDKAKEAAEKNITQLREYINKELPVIGIEPSSILTFRDEYPDLVNNDIIDDAKKLAEHTFTIEEFLWIEFEKGNITKAQFTKEKNKILYHGHCYQKALSDTSIIKKILEVPQNYKAEEIKSGCCGMAGSFGHESEHVSISKQIGELKLFPAIRNKKKEEIIAASGTSCRKHIEVNTGVKVLHPVEILYEAVER